ncbi:hypothetical protein V8D89_008635 [Ganoderma adspersum]
MVGDSEGERFQAVSGGMCALRAHELHPNKPPAPSHPKPPSRAPAPKTDDDVTPQPPEGPSTEYRLMASKLNGWKYDVMKFESRKRIEINASGFLVCRLAS